LKLIYIWVCNIYREAFAGFDANIVAKMGEKEITDIASDKAIMLAESRVRSIVDNAKCILKASLFSQQLELIYIYIYIYIYNMTCN